MRTMYCSLTNVAKLSLECRYKLIILGRLGKALHHQLNHCVMFYFITHILNVQDAYITPANTPTTFGTVLTYSIHMSDMSPKD